MERSAVFPDVVVVGAAGIDTCVYLAEGQDISSDVTFTSNRDGVGQAGGYASLAYRALGYRVAYYGAIGDDDAGSVLRRDLEAHGVDTSASFLDPMGTARSVNLMSPDGRRRGCYDGRGNPGLDIDPATVAELLHGVRLVHVNIPNWARHVLPIARAAGCLVISDLQDVADPLDPYRLDFVRGSDVLAFSCTRDVTPEPMMRAYWDVNPDLVQIAGMGAEGCAVGVAGTVERQAPPPSDLPIVDTNGAGDALAAVAAAGIVLETLSPPTAAELGQRAARIVSSQRVPKHRFASWDELTGSGQW
jgi:sugar/nucleoside kinase (ribokinase family)